MKNPWARKNPFMSMWLSGANSVLGSARGHAAAVGKREIGKAAAAGRAEAAAQVADFWTAALRPPGAARKKRRSR